MSFHVFLLQNIYLKSNVREATNLCVILRSLANGCEYDYVEVFDGITDKSPKLGKYCGQTKPSVRTSTSHQLLITFVADATVKRTGFRIKYHAKGKEVYNAPMYT